MLGGFAALDDRLEIRRKRSRWSAMGNPMLRSLLILGGAPKSKCVRFLGFEGGSGDIALSLCCERIRGLGVLPVLLDHRRGISSTANIAYGIKKAGAMYIGVPCVTECNAQKLRWFLKRGEARNVRASSPAGA